ncbi:penicillin-binding transpeptidase domain-containing protein [Massilia sp. SM-13]|uniref:penicillin-binding transpeptidase domain-containing protein n=1 Tax=Pseudoduganella rhizocola TaxID=3382643 RepID=UPI0038B6356E
MAGKYTAFLDGLQLAWRRRRRAGDFGAGRRLPLHGLWLPMLAALSVAAGGAILALHAQRLGETSGSTQESASQQRLARLFQPVLPGAAFVIEAGAPAGAQMIPQPSGALMIAYGLQAAPLLRVDLCTQLSGERIVPLRIGYRFSDVERWQRQAEAKGQPLGLRNILLLSDASANTIPQLDLAGKAWMEAPLSLRWRAKGAVVQWISDANGAAIEHGAEGQSTLRRQGWLSWGRGALRIERRPSGICPRAGELVLQMYLPKADGAASALVAGMSVQGRAAAAMLQPGPYQVPAAAPAALEDQTLFSGLLAHGLIRTGAGGLLEAAPPDLPAWRSVPASARVAAPEAWQGATLDDKGRKLLKRLYQQADGAYVREQIDIYNSERQLLAWRFASASASALRAAAGDAAAGAYPFRPAEARDAAAAHPGSTASAPLAGTTGSAGPEGRRKAMPLIEARGINGPLPQTSAMPASSARLFEDLPQGWQPWTRVAQWPANQSAPVKLTVSLPRPSNGSETLRLLLIGRIDTSQGASGAILRATPACTGRACPDGAAVQSIELRPQAGVREITFTATPLNAAANERNADRRYRHLVSTEGLPDWQPLANLPPARTAAQGAQGQASRILLHDRNGSLLWSAGAPTRQAQDAGLATMLGLNTEHASSIAGMLARANSADGAASAQLTIDLPLQGLSQKILDCIAMRRGHWTGSSCAGGGIVPEDRHAGFVLLDAETGDVLVAAGAGAAPAGAAGWSELRDFDRANPARSPLRLPALQHDGGAHQSPGSTFKVVSALGLEIAAQSDRQLDAMLDGLPLQKLNAVARERGFAFETGAPVYPVTPKQAHITNYREQGLDRRAQEGRLGVSQALTYSLNTWFAWSAEMSDRSLFGRASGGLPALQPLEAGALDTVRPIVAAARLLGFEQPLRLDGGLLPPDFQWSAYDALQGTPAHFDPIHTRHELRQMSIGLRMQATPLQMALASAAIGQGAVVAPRLLLVLNGREAAVAQAAALKVRLDRIRAGMKGVVDRGTAAGAFGGKQFAHLRPGLYGKTGTAPVTEDEATVWFTGWLEPGTLPGQRHRLAFAAFASHSEASGGDHAAPVVAAVLSELAKQNGEQKGK